MFLSPRCDTMQHAANNVSHWLADMLERAVCASADPKFRTAGMVRCPRLSTAQLYVAACAGGLE